MIGSIRVHPSSQYTLRSINIVLFFVAAFMAGVSRIEAAEPWDFIRVGKSNTAVPKWEPRSGKAQIEIQGNHIEIHAYYTDGGVGSNGELGPGSVVINGTLGKDRTINATGTILNTDANPFQLRGKYITRDDLEIWGTKRKIVTHKEIVFPRPPNGDFWGFLNEDVRDE
jgi:hypothetical protein